MCFLCNWLGKERREPASVRALPLTSVLFTCQGAPLRYNWFERAVGKHENKLLIWWALLFESFLHIHWRVTSEKTFLNFSFLFPLLFCFFLNQGSFLSSCLSCFLFPLIPRRICSRWPPLPEPAAAGGVFLLKGSFYFPTVAKWWLIRGLGC